MRQLVIGLGLAFGLLVAPPAGAEPAADRVAWSSTQDEDEATLASWREQLDEARDRLYAARRRVETLEGAKGRGSSRRYPRGDAKAEYLDDLDEAHEELADAERALPELLEEARRAGVPPGVLADYEDLAGES